MSLLLDALKRAEEAKRAKDAPATDRFLETAPPHEAIPLPPRQPSDLQLSEFTETIPPRGGQVAKVPPGKAATPAAPPPRSFLGDAELAPVESFEAPAPAPKVSPREMPVDDREAAKNVFVSKRTTKDRGGKAAWLIPTLAITISALGAGGWYLWEQMRPRGGLSNQIAVAVPKPANTTPTAAPPPAADARSATVAPTTEAAASSGTPATSVTVATAPPPPSLPPAAPATGQPIEKAKAPVVALAPPPVVIPPLIAPSQSLPKTPTPKARVPRAPRVDGEGLPEAALTERDLLAKQLRQARAAKEEPVGLRLSRSIDAPKINPDVANAYQALTASDFEQAKKLYVTALQGEPTNVDAHLGLATAHARLGDTNAAVQHYRRVLELDPRNSTAVNGLIAVSSGTRPEQLENELRALLAKDANSAALHFSLGNVYASERRWHEAQQSYFDAFRLQGDNADYVYNLAVSLDKLSQSRLANDYYQKALQLAGKGGAQFDRAQVQRRIDELKGG